MKRIRNLGLAALAALALMAVLGAAGASASGFVSDSSGTSTISGFGRSFGGFADAQEVTSNLGVVRCNNFPFESRLEKQGKTLTTTSLKSVSCGSFSFKPNGCQFTYHPGVEASAGHFGGTLDIGPAGCAPMSFTVFGCTAQFGAQSGLAAAYENVGTGTLARVNVDMNASKVQYTIPGGAGCSAGTFANASWTSHWSIMALNAAGAETGLHVVKGSGVYVAGVTPKLEAEKYPVSLLGTQTTALKFALNGGNASCESAQLEGKISAASAEQSLGSQYSGCAFGGFAATIASNGCQYVLHLTTGSPFYAGTADISCPAGKVIEITGKIGGVTKCTATISSQSGLEGIGFTNIGTGSERGVQAGLNLLGIKYHQQAGTGVGACKTTGDFSDGALTGGVALFDELH